MNSTDNQLFCFPKEGQTDFIYSHKGLTIYLSFLHHGLQFLTIYFVNRGYCFWGHKYYMSQWMAGKKLL